MGEFWIAREKKPGRKGTVGDYVLARERRSLIKVETVDEVEWQGGERVCARLGDITGFLLPTGVGPVLIELREVPR